MKTIVKFTILFFVFHTLQSCTDDEIPTIEEEQAPRVASMFPLAGPKGTIVSFSGTNFETDNSMVTVHFDNINAELVSLTETEIKVIVPARAFYGVVRLVIGEARITGFNFDYEITDIQVSTLAGNGEMGFSNGTGTNVLFGSPYDIVMDVIGNLYVADVGNHSIRKIDLNNEVITFAGNERGFADGEGNSASFRFPFSLTTDTSGNIYVADTFNHKIRKITKAGVVTTIAGSIAGYGDGIGTAALFNFPIGIAIDVMDNLYVADRDNHKIRKITPNGAVTTIAGSTEGFADANGTGAQFNWPTGIAIDTRGVIYVADSRNHRIRKIDNNAQVTTLAGGEPGFADGIGSNALFSSPNGVVLDTKGNIYVADSNNNSIRKIDTTSRVTTIAGNTDFGFQDGPAIAAQFNNPNGLVVDDSFTIYVADSFNYAIRKLSQE